MKLRLDFVHPRPSPAPIGWVLLLAGLLALGWAGWRHHTVSQAHRAESARLLALTPRPLGKPVVKAAPGKAETGFQTPRNLLAADWGALLSLLEKTRPAGIAFLSLEVDAARGDLLLTAEARDHKAMLAYVDALERQSILTRVALASHADQEREDEKAVRFNLRARWVTP